MLVDGFGHPFQYDPGGKFDPVSKRAVPNGNTIHTSYDVWSFAQAKPGIPPAAPTKIQKQDGKLTAYWIKNW